jgi:hypothetical protein
MNFDDLIRRSRVETLLDKPGQIGIGRGGAAGPAPKSSESTQMNAQIRRAAMLLRGRLTPEDLWP